MNINILSNIIKGEILVNQSLYQKIDHISIDTRTIYDGFNNLFIALKTKKNDGHKYLYQAFEKGIRVFIVSQQIDVNLYPSCTFILVEDTLKALQSLARSKRQSFGKTVLGITGSNGKTIVKEWLYQVLRNEFRITKSPKSYNSQVGVPLSIWPLDNRSELAIFEAGISEPGEMDALAEMIVPHIGIFTNLGEAHQQQFETAEEKLKEKLKLFKHSNTIICSADTPWVANSIETFARKNKIKTYSWSLKNKDADLKIQISKLEDNKTQVLANFQDKQLRFIIPFSDETSVQNCCTVLLALLVLKIDVEVIINQMQLLEPIAMRMEINRGINNCVIINDAYNSDILSLDLAMDVLNQQASKGVLSKTLIVSDILQSSMKEEVLYKKLASIIHQKGISKLIGIGPSISKYGELFSVKKTLFPSTSDFMAQLDRNSFINEVILIKGARKFEFEIISSRLQEKKHQTILEIDLTALVNNLNVFRNYIKPETKVMAMVKAFSYGSGIIEIARALQFHGIDYFAVAIADEGVELRKNGIKTPIVVMNPESSGFQSLIDFNLEPNIYDLSELKTFTSILQRNGITNYPCHLKIDTGMNRLGFKTTEAIKEALEWIISNKELHLSSVFSHLVASDDEEKDEFTREQIHLFQKVTNSISKQIKKPFIRHILNSAGIERFSEYQFEMVRLGIGLYGISSLSDTKKTNMLQNVSTLKTTISQIKNITKNDTVGYGRKGLVKKDSKIAILPIGYADGLNRHLGCGKGYVIINHQKAPFIGNICMDMCMVDISDIDAQQGDEVIVFGKENPITNIAWQLDTIAYEVLTSISQRVKRIYFQE